MKNDAIAILSLRSALVRWRARWLLLALVTIASFSVLLGAGFINMDDQVYVTENENVRGGLDPDSIRWAFTTHHASVWLPVTWLSHMIDCELFGLDARFHHATNLLIHVLNSILLFLVLARLTGRPGPAWLVAAVFALHPLHVESVAWIAERKDVLSTFWVFLALWAYLVYVEKPGVGRYLLVFLLVLLGILSKLMALTAPLLLLLLDWWPLRRHRGSGAGETGSGRRSWKFLVAEKIPLLALSSTLGIYTVHLMKGQVALITGDLLPLSTRILNTLPAYVFYLQKTFLPVGLAVFYPYPAEGSLAGYLAAGVLLAVVSAYSVLRREKQPYLLFGWLWYLISLGPTVGLVQQSRTLVGDRYSYVPLVGIALAVVWLLSDVIVRRGISRRTTLVTSVVVVAVLAGLTIRQASLWRDSETLFRHCIRVTEGNYMAHATLGLHLLNQGRTEEAVDHLESAFRNRHPIFPMPVQPITLVQARVRLAGEWKGAGKPAKALDQYEKAISESPGNATLHYNTGALLGRLGRHGEAIGHYRAALNIDPTYPDAGNNLGLALFRAGRTEEAVQVYEELLAKDPANALVNYNAACVHAGAGYLDRALALLRASLANGFDDRRTLETDPDLANLRETREFKDLIRTMAQ